MSSAAVAKQVLPEQVESAETPTVSVLMTTHNNSLTKLSAAIHSILSQTFHDLELIVVFEPGDPNFAMTSATNDDPRLVVVQNEVHRGRSDSYNTGLRHARGRYLARMDADDFSHPERLERQLAFLKANPEISLVGSSVRLIDERGNDLGVRHFPPTHDRIVSALALTDPISHPAVVWDREKVGRDLQFDCRFSRYCDDLELWLRLLAQGHKFSNVPEVLLDYQQPDDHARPREHWRLNFRARLLHGRLALRHPMMFVGMIAFGVLMLLPDRVIKALTARNSITDQLRLIRTGAVSVGLGAPGASQTYDAPRARRA